MSPVKRTPEQKQRLQDEAIARAWAHPVRVKAFRLLADGVYSPVEIARLIGVPLQNVVYHVHFLEELGLVEVVGQRQVRGAVQNFFRAITRPMMDDEEWAALPVEDRRPLSRYTLQLIFGDTVDADEHGTLDARPERHITRVPMQVDEAGWDELREIHLDALERIQEVAGAVAQRQAEGAETFPVVSSTLFFEMPSPSPPGRRDENGL